MLPGLPESYKPMILGLENLSTLITTDSIKIKLLQDVKDVKDKTKSALVSSKFSSKTVSTAEESQMTSISRVINTDTWPKIVAKEK